ncbi:MAG: F0F1 ATP synthase subunit delta [Actinomycetota bacterium]|jgi:F-type H+-transporting ATPase subunit delta|nr:F0F1 ATP synthase subunit delta [Actinomycetota bacterium]
MDGVSRDSLRAALARFEEQVGSLPGGAEAGTVSEGLYAVAALLDREPSLRRAFTDPASSPQSRRGLAERLLSGQLPDLPLRTFSDLVASPWSSAADLRQAVETVAANAALRAAEGDGVLDDVEDELFRFARLLEREPQLRGALTDPGLPDDRKAALLRSLLGGRAQPATVRLVEILVTRPRGRSLEVALEELSRLAAARRQRLLAKVTVARPLDELQAQRLRAALAGTYGREVDLQVDVDPGVLGGVRVRVGDEVIDGTVTSRLRTARRRLAG